MTEHPDIAEHRAKHGVVHTSLGRRLDRVAKTASDNDVPGANESPLRAQPLADGPLPHHEQEKRLAEPKWDHKSFTKVEPVKLAVQGAQGYASKLHLPDPHAISYRNIHVTPDQIRSVGRAYDALPTRDPAAIPHYERMRKEIQDQHHHLTHVMGVRTDVVHDDPYPTVEAMVHDVTHNKRIKVLSTKATGGHDFLSDDENDKFRAVHDVFGHAATGRGFDRHGEEAAWHAHSRMFTPHARGAMSSETRGQNSALHLNGAFQEQKTALLPSHMWDDNAMNKHSTLLPFEAFLTTAIGWEDDSRPNPYLQPEGEHQVRYQVRGRSGHVEAVCQDCGTLGYGPTVDHGDVEKAHTQARGKTAANMKKMVLEDPPPSKPRTGPHALHYSAPFGNGYVRATCTGCDFQHGSYAGVSHEDATSAHEGFNGGKTATRKVSTVHVMHPTEGGTLCGTDISKQKPNEPGFETTCQTCRGAMEDDVSYSSKSDMARWNLKDVLGTRKVAHDSGDGETIFHCPFCGSGQVIARSDRTIECQFCHTCFTVQVQPEYPAFPQTVNGVPVQVPGMPGQMGVDPAGAGGPMEDPEADGNPFTKGSMRTTAGKDLPVEDYIAHLAVRHSRDRETTLAAVRARRG